MCVCIYMYIILYYIILYHISYIIKYILYYYIIILYTIITTITIIIIIILYRYDIYIYIKCPSRRIVTPHPLVLLLPGNPRIQLPEVSLDAAPRKLRFAQHPALRVMRGEQTLKWQVGLP